MKLLLIVMFTVQLVTMGFAIAHEIKHPTKTNWAMYLLVGVMSAVQFVQGNQ